MLQYLKVSGKPVYQCQIDLHLQFPHGQLDEKNAVRTTMEICGRPHPTAAEVLIITNYLQIVTDHNILRDKSKTKGSGLKKSNYPKWRDFYLILNHMADTNKSKNAYSSTR
jgi:hypothetical protein